MRDGLAIHLQRDEVRVPLQQRAGERTLSRPDLHDRRSRGSLYGVDDAADRLGVGEKVLTQTFLGADGHGRAER